MGRSGRVLSIIKSGAILASVFADETISYDFLRGKRFWFHTFPAEKITDEGLPKWVRSVMQLHNTDHEMFDSIAQASKIAEDLPEMGTAEHGRSYLVWAKAVKDSNDKLPAEYRQDHNDL